jgi:hypothetical protein
MYKNQYLLIGAIVGLAVLAGLAALLWIHPSTSPRQNNRAGAPPPDTRTLGRITVTASSSVTVALLSGRLGPGGVPVASDQTKTFAIVPSTTISRQILTDPKIFRAELAQFKAHGGPTPRAYTDKTLNQSDLAVGVDVTVTPTSVGSNTAAHIEVLTLKQ